jgi:hypothetical protein
MHSRQLQTVKLIKLYILPLMCLLTTHCTASFLDYLDAPTKARYLTLDDLDKRRCKNRLLSKVGDIVKTVYFSTADDGLTSKQREELELEKAREIRALIRGILDKPLATSPYNGNFARALIVECEAIISALEAPVNYAESPPREETITYDDDAETYSVPNY